MIVEQSPVYDAVRNGLAAPYSINFANDLNHFIPLTSLWQGDPVKAKSLYINNYSSQYAITVSNGSFNQTVPAFSAGSIDIRGFDSVTVTSESSNTNTISMSVLSFSTDYGFQTRTFQPLGLTNDPRWSLVTDLYHFNGNNGFTVGYNEQKANARHDQLILAGGAAISTGDSKFGGSSLKTPGGGTAVSSALTGTLVNTDITIEFFANLVAPGGSFNNQPLITLVSAGVASPAISVDFSSGTAFKVKVTNGASTVIQGVNTYTTGVWYHFAYCAVGTAGGILFVNGVQDTSTGSSVGYPSSSTLNAFYNPVSAINFSGTAYMDELRITNYARYMANFTVPTSEFFSQ